MAGNSQVPPATSDYKSRPCAGCASGILRQLGYYFEDVESQNSANDDDVQVVLMLLLMLVLMLMLMLFAEGTRTPSMRLK
jgi:hypothetical protein